MNNLFFGFSTFVLSILIFYFSFKKCRQEQYTLSLYLLILGGILLRVFVCCDFYLHEWDERYHALVAKNLLENPFAPMLYTNPLLDYDYRSWASNHIWVHKQPVPLYSMALSMLIFGKNVIALRLPSILMGAVGIWSTFKIGGLLYSKKIGIMAAFLFSINGFILELTAARTPTDHIDVFFLSFISLAIYFLLKSVRSGENIHLILGGVITALAILTKWLPALIVIPIWFIASWQKNDFITILKKGSLLVLVIVAVSLPWQLYIYAQFPLEAAWESAYNKMHIFEALGPHGQPFYYHFDKMRIIFGELIYLPVLWLIYRMLKSRFEPKKTILFVWIFIPYLFFSAAVTKMSGYTMITAPALFILIAIFYEHLISLKTKWPRALNLLAILLFLLPIRYTIERAKPFSTKVRTMPWITRVQELERNQDEQDAVMFNCKYPIETMFHTDFIAYEQLPSLEKLIEIKNAGYLIYIDNAYEIPLEKSQLDFVKYVSISTE